MNGAYLRAAIKAEVKRCRMRGEDRIRSRYLAEECGLPIAAHVPEVRRAVRELNHPPPELHGPAKRER